jgi:uncharacterized protein (DUF1330 family)
MNASSPCTVILTGTLKPGAQTFPEFQDYAQRSAANGEANGGKVLGKYLISENLGQGSTPTVVFVVEFPSQEIARGTFTNDEYTSIIPLRDKVFDEVKILIGDVE